MPVPATEARAIASRRPREVIRGVLRRRQSGFPSAAALGQPWSRRPGRIKEVPSDMFFLFVARDEAAIRYNETEYQISLKQ